MATTVNTSLTFATLDEIMDELSRRHRKVLLCYEAQAPTGKYTDLCWNFRHLTTSEVLGFIEYMKLSIHNHISHDS